MRFQYLKSYFILFTFGLLLAVQPGPDGIFASNPETTPEPDLATLPEPLAIPGESSRSTQSPEAPPTFEEQVMELVNEARWDNGQLPPLKMNTQLNSSAETHSANMANRDFFAHKDLDDNCSTPNQRMVAAGYVPNSWGENIAAGYSSPTSVMNGWMNSSGHRANILGTSFRELGIGHVHQSNDQSGVRIDRNYDCAVDETSPWPYYHYWTQNFGKQNEVYPVVIAREAYETTSPAVSLYMYGGGWAEEMRFCNAGRFWSDWMPYSPDASWTLAGGNGVKTVLAEIRQGDTVRMVSDTIFLNESLRALMLPLDVLLYMPFIPYGASGNPPCQLSP